MEVDDDQELINLPIGQAIIEPDQGNQNQEEEDEFLQNFQNLQFEENIQNLDSIEPDYFLNIENESRCVQFIKGTNLLGYRDKKYIIIQDIITKKIIFKRKLWAAYGVLAISNNSQYLAADGKDVIIHVWDLNNKEQKSIQLDGHSDQICSICFSYDNKYLFSGGKDGKLLMWDLQTFQHKNILRCENYIEHISARPLFLAVSSSDCYIKFLNLKNGKIAKTYQTNHQYVCLPYQNGHFYISGDQIGKLKLWTKNNKQIRCHKFPGFIWRLDVSQNYIIVPIFQTQQIFVLANVSFQILKKLKQKTDWTPTVSISDDQKIIAASDDNGLRVWNI
ncbi:hypothetical protein pb186bvf_003563 [Paramecium bursaria]